MFGNKTQVQVRSDSGLFADATKLKPRSMALQILKGAALGAVGFAIPGKGIQGGKMLYDAVKKEKLPSEEAFEKLEKFPFVSIVSGAVLGAIYQWEKTRVHNKWVDTVASQGNALETGTHAERASSSSQKEIVSREGLSKTEQLQEQKVMQEVGQDQNTR
ncbi:MAG: hypothetical protein P8P30_00100 [Rickettsiales bacterium]|nr:hypothetical protein [Rickettsiales bacterium]